MTGDPHRGPPRQSQDGAQHSNPSLQETLLAPQHALLNRYLAAFLALACLLARQLTWGAATMRVSRPQAPEKSSSKFRLAASCLDCSSCIMQRCRCTGHHGVLLSVAGGQVFAVKHAVLSSGQGTAHPCSACSAHPAVQASSGSAADTAYTFTPEDVQRGADLPDLTELTEAEKVPPQLSVCIPVSRLCLQCQCQPAADVQHRACGMACCWHRDGTLQAA